MTSQTADYRVLDERLNGHARRLEILEQNHEKLSTNLAHIQRTLTQIKWMGGGMVLMLLVQELGIIEVLKKLL